MAKNLGVLGRRATLDRCPDPTAAKSDCDRPCLHRGGEGVGLTESSMRQSDRRAGRVNEFGPETTGRMLDGLVASLSARLRLEQDARVGSIPTPPTAAVETT